MTINSNTQERGFSGTPATSRQADGLSGNKWTSVCLLFGNSGATGLRPAAARQINSLTASATNQPQHTGQQYPISEPHRRHDMNSVRVIHCIQETSQEFRAGISCSAIEVRPCQCVSKIYEGCCEPGNCIPQQDPPALSRSHCRLPGICHRNVCILDQHESRNQHPGQLQI